MTTQANARIDPDRLNELLGQGARVAPLALGRVEQLRVLLRRDQAVGAERLEQGAGGMDRHRDRNASYAEPRQAVPVPALSPW